MALGRHLIVLPLALPLSAALSPARLEASAGSIGGRLGAALAGAAPTSHSPSSPAVEMAALETEALQDEGAGAALSLPGEPQRAGSRRRSHELRADAKPGGGIFVNASTVLRLARAGMVPSGQPIGRTVAHPAGIELLDAGALGVGLSNGDVLTEVEGRAVQTEGQVVGLVVGARARHAEKISAVFFRGTERWSLVVAMPYVPAER